ncbi:hypothetical protein KIPB_012833, partial [Kipferlia bialata]|eukprot:g12833.t1
MDALTDCLTGLADALYYAGMGLEGVVWGDSDSETEAEADMETETLPPEPIPPPSPVSPSRPNTLLTLPYSCMVQ